jgi:hypothetical protein
MPIVARRSVRSQLAIAILVAACGSAQAPASVTPTVLQATATERPASATAGPISTPVATAPTPTTRPPAEPLASLVHCSGEASGTSLASFHRMSTWAGYVAALPPGTASCVEASWIEPVVTCGSEDAAVGIWVGIGGYSSQDIDIWDDGHALEQAGTGVDCEGGIAEHYAWHQTSPRQATDLPFAATPTHRGEMVIFGGDRMWAQVRYSAGAFTMTVANLSSGDVRAVTEASLGRHRSSAEWIVGGEDDLAIPRFGTIKFEAGTATLAGNLGAIGSAAWHRNWVDEWQDRVTRLQTSRLSRDGASFTVSWMHG